MGFGEEEGETTCRADVGDATGGRKEERGEGRS